jgi:hypothetical protein
VLATTIHRQFYIRLPDSLRWVEVLPGRLREDDVQVGQHIAPSPDELPGWMARFDESAPERYGRAERLVVIVRLVGAILMEQNDKNDEGLCNGHDT